MNGTYENIDCMELMANLKDKSVDLAIVDPPYGIGEDGRHTRGRVLRKDNTEIYKIDKRSGRRVLIAPTEYSGGRYDDNIPDESYFKELFRVSKNQIIWGENYFPYHFGNGRIFWDKCVSGDFSDGEIAYCSLFESTRKITYMWSGFKQAESLSNGSKMQGNKKLNEKRIHPNHKPVKLYEWLLSNYAKPNDLILDTHCGSASSLIACENLGFKYIASELDKDYYSQSLQRLEAHLSQGKLFQRVGGDVILSEQPSMFA